MKLASMLETLTSLKAEIALVDVKYSQLRTGVQRSTLSLTRSYMSGLRSSGNLPNTSVISTGNFGSCTLGNTEESLSTTKQFELDSCRPKTSCYTNMGGTLTSKTTGLGEHIPLLPPMLGPFKSPSNQALPSPQGSATTSMLGSVAKLDASIDMPVSTAIMGDITEGLQSVPSWRVKESSKLKGQDILPKYARGFLWEEDKVPCYKTSADLSQPVPLPPSPAVFAPKFLHTIETYSHLFTIVTPINVSRLEHYLQDHPNRLFVTSVLRMMKEGTWPWAHEPPAEFMPINDQLQDIADLVKSPARLTFFQEECCKEQALGRSSEFFPHLLPGMSCMPMYIVERRGKM